MTLIGLLVRHRGSLAADLACTRYAVYPAALVASQSLLLEPWLNLFCLLGALLVFPSGRLADSRRLACGGGFGRTVFVSGLAQSTHGRFGPRLRLADITGLTGLTGLASFTGGGSFRLGAAIAVAVVVSLLIAVAWILSPRAARAGRAGRADEPDRSGLTPLDRYVLLGAVVVTVMMFVSSEWYEYYAAFDGPFIVLAVALPVARLVAVTRLRPVEAIALTGTFGCSASLAASAEKVTSRAAVYMGALRWPAIGAKDGSAGNKKWLRGQRIASVGCLVRGSRSRVMQDGRTGQEPAPGGTRSGDKANYIRKDVAIRGALARQPALRSR